MPERITRDDIINFINDNPDRTNPRHHDSAYYFDELGQPGCVMGCILDKAGYERGCVGEGMSIHVYLDLFDSPNTALFAKKVQRSADARLPWGDALIRAQETPRPMEGAESDV